MGLPNATYDLIGNYRKVPLDINHWTGQPSVVQCPFTIHVGRRKLIKANKKLAVIISDQCFGLS